MNNKTPKRHPNAARLRSNPSLLSVAIRQTLRATTRRQLAPLMALSLGGLATPALAQDAVVELSSLDGSTGFVLNGVTVGYDSGRSVSAAGDVNGDGVDDLLIGARGADPNGSLSGASYVVFGASGVGSSGTLELSALNGSNGFVLNGVTTFDFSGYSVSAAGDVNGDGVDDLLIGASGADPNGSASGASYVVFGASGVGSSGTLELSALDGSNGFVLNGVTGSDLSGYSVSAAGDVNGDGVDDLLIGASGADPNGRASGASYVVFGASGVGSSGTLELSALDGSNGFVLNGVTADDYSGHSVSAAGDVNGDGIDDLLIGASGADPNGSASGASYVVFGASGVGSSGTLELSALNGSNGFVLNGVTASDFSGFSVSAAGDVNGDGVDDLLIGAYGADPNGDSSGASYVVFGASGVGSSGSLELSALDGSNGFVLNGVTTFDVSGYSVSAAGDVNGDGVDDLLIGADGADPNVSSSGASYVVFGASGVGSSGSLELSALDGSNGFVLNGVTTFDFSGNSVSAAGDVNGDGVDDLLIGAFGADSNGSNSGVSYVVFGEGGDMTPPVISAALTPALPNGLNGWYVSDIGITWVISDPESAFMIDSGCVDQTINVDTDGLALSCMASSAGGSNSVSETVKRDATAPVVTLTTPAEAAVYVLNQAVIADWSASDATLPGSGLASSSGSVANGQPVNTSSVGAQTFSVIAADVAGHQTSVDHNYTVLSATPAIDVLIGNVQALGLRHYLERQLVRKLQKAKLALTKGKTNKAIRQLNAFIRRVNAKSGKKIDAGDAAALVAYTQLILGAI